MMPGMHDAVPEMGGGWSTIGGRLRDAPYLCMVKLEHLAPDLLLPSQTGAVATRLEIEQTRLKGVSDVYPPRRSRLGRGRTLGSASEWAAPVARTSRLR